jgi:prepilin-type N-terminal cleavage/methylation domain-containing protein
MNKVVLIKRDNGFTLLEIITAIVVAGILGVMIVQFVRTSAVKSVFPVTLLKKQYDLQSQVEDMTGYYRRVDCKKSILQLNVSFKKYC